MDEKAKESAPLALRVARVALPVVAIAMAVYQLAYTQYLLQDPTGHRITHLGFAFVVVFLSLMLRSKKGWHAKLVLLLASVAVTGYLMILLDEILTYRSARPFTSDLVIGLLALFLAFAGSYLIFGKTFPIIAAAFMAYLYLGRYLPYPFMIAPVPVERLIMWLSAGVGSPEGIYGDILSISANYLFLFILFGAMLHAFGGTRFIIGIGQWIGSRLYLALCCFLEHDDPGCSGPHKQR